MAKHNLIQYREPTASMAFILLPSSKRLLLPVNVLVSPSPKSSSKTTKKTHPRQYHSNTRKFHLFLQDSSFPTKIPFCAIFSPNLCWYSPTNILFPPLIFLLSSIHFLKHVHCNLQCSHRWVLVRICSYETYSAVQKCVALRSDWNISAQVQKKFSTSPQIVEVSTKDSMYIFYAQENY